jgi:hypothetical protein
VLWPSITGTRAHAGMLQVLVDAVAAQTLQRGSGSSPSQRHRDELATLNAELRELRAQGRANGHPDVKRLMVNEAYFVPRRTPTSCSRICADS